MIYYFSGTGNSEWVAKQIAKETGDEAQNIINLNREEARIVNEGSVVGFVFPVYAWAPVGIMTDFIKTFTIKPNVFTFAIGTCGENAGNTMKVISSLIPLGSAYSIRMPNNYVIGGNLDSEDVVTHKIAEAKKVISQIAGEITNRTEVWRIQKGALPFLKTSVVAPLFNKFARSTKAFHTDASCNSCGLCEKLCPKNTIHLENGKPIWGSDCLQCLSCINGCPKQAIQYGNLTKNRTRYYFK